MDGRLMEIKMKLYFVIVYLIMNYLHDSIEHGDYSYGGEGDGRASVSLRLHSN